MNIKPPAYGKLCSLYYDATKTFATEKEIAFFSSFMKLNGRVLEAMSGSGRLQIPLLKLGFIVDGVDNSKAMLDRCRKRCAELSLNPEIYEQSLENLDLPYKYQTVTIAVASFQLITDRAVALTVLKNLKKHMLESGDLLIDIFVPDVKTDGRFTRTVRIDEHTNIRLTTRYVFDEQAKIADAYCSYELIINGIVQEYENELITTTWYDDAELSELLGQAGFKLIKIYDENFRISGPSRVVHAQAV